MKTFYAVLGNTVAALITNTFVWFALTFWVYLETRSVIATSVMAGVYATAAALSGVFLGSLVDRFPKRAVMVGSSLISLAFFLSASTLFAVLPGSAFSDISSPPLWIFIVLSLLGVVAGNIRMIALSTLVTVLIPEPRRDRANGAIGVANGVSFLAATTLSGAAIGFAGLSWVFIGAIAASALVALHLMFLRIPDAPPTHSRAVEPEPSPFDLPQTIRVVWAVPGLAGLIFFQTFNNFLGGIFMALMDAYGLLLVSVQVWGAIWGALSLGFIVGSALIARVGLGRKPLRTLFLANGVMWAVGMVFTIHPSIESMAAGMLVWMCLTPAVEAAEQTIMQKVVPPTQQGRVFGLAQSVEQAASPITSFLIGPIAQLVFIPFMTDGAGVDLIGPWFGSGTDRGIALLFSVSGLIGLLVTLVGARSRAYRHLAGAYVGSEPRP